MRPARGPAQVGLTLIELMISMVIASLLVALILGVHAKMSAAYQVQGKLADLGKTLRAGRGRLISDLRQAGFMIPDGFKTSAFGTPDAIVAPLLVDNDAEGDGPDGFSVFYADPIATARVLTIQPGTRQFATLAEPGGFAVGDLAVLTNPLLEAGDATTSAIATYDACVVRVTEVEDATTPPVLRFASGSAPFNTASNAHCADVANATAAEGVSSETVAYRLVARRYRIDPARRAAGVLQVAPFAGLLGEGYEDLAVGVINLQVATRFAEPADAVDLDADGDPTRDWYSGDGQEPVDPDGERPAAAVPVQVTLSLEVRTLHPIAESSAAATPSLTDDSEPPESVSHNPIGDWASVDLSSADADRPVAYRGRHVFRASSTTIDLRNIGVGR